jgi:hypothetical protein
MKYIKKFEVSNSLPTPFPPEEKFNVGDTVYCTDNKGYERDIEIGVPYTVSKVDDRIKDYTIITIAELESRWSSRRFSKDPEHVDITIHKLKSATNIYNL